jgi:hypothetical protein
MPQVFTIQGARLGQDEGEKCKCVYNGRTKRRTKLCFVGKSAKHRTGWKFVKGGC